MKKVVVVEDSPEIGRLIKSSLNTLNIDLDVNVLPSAEEAQIEIFRQRVDLLITDIRLPGITGIDLAKKVKKTYPDIKIIIVTGLSEEEFGKDLEIIKPDSFFRKPININRFLKVVSKTLGYEDNGEDTQANTAKKSSSFREELRKILDEYSEMPGLISLIMLDQEGEILTSTQQEIGTEIKSLIDAHFQSIVNICSKGSWLLNYSLTGFRVELTGSKSDYFIVPGKNFSLLIEISHETDESTRIKILNAVGALNIKLSDYLEINNISGDIAEVNMTAFDDNKKADVFEQSLDKKKISNENMINENELLSILNKPDSEQLDETDLDEYWETNQETFLHEDESNPDMMSFEKAKSMGLISDEIMKEENDSIQHGSA